MTDPSPRACTNCGNAQVDVYCAHCGEKQPDRQDFTVGHFLHGLADELFHLDSKLFRTLRDLMLRPGELTAAYFEGRKQRYVAPLRLILALFALTFIAYSSYKPVALYSLDGVLTGLDAQGSLRKLLEDKAAERKVPVADLMARIDQTWQKTMSFLNLASIVAVAALLKLLYVRHRRYFAEHLVFSTHYMCFMYVLSLLIWPVYLVIGIRQNLATSAMTFVTFVVSCVYIYFALRRVYRQSGAKTLLKSIVLWAGTALTSAVLIYGSLTLVIVRVLRP